MIRLNSFPYSLVSINNINNNFFNMLGSNNPLGGIYNKQNNELINSLENYFQKNVVLTNNGTNALLISIEYAINLFNDKKIKWIISEFIYFSLASFLMSRKEEIIVLESQFDEVTLIEPSGEMSDDFSYIVLLTSHNNKSVNVIDSIKKLKNKFIIIDSCLVFENVTLNADVSCYSFSNNKLIVAGEGGCLTSSIKDFVEWAKWRTFSGIVPTKNIDFFMYMGMYTAKSNDCPYKASISGLVSSLIYEQINNLNNIIEKRIENYEYLTQKLSKSCETINYQNAPLFYSLVLPEYSFKKIQSFQIKCFKSGVQTGMGVLPLEFYTDFSKKKKRILNLPIHTEITNQDLDKISDIIIKNYEN